MKWTNCLCKYYVIISIVLKGKIYNYLKLTFEKIKVRPLVLKERPKKIYMFIMDDYDLELIKAVEEIKKNNSELVCIQLPDGLKPKAKEIHDFLEKNTQAKIIIWLGSCWGGCDLPLQIEKMKVDLLIQWGHSVYIRSW